MPLAENFRIIEKFKIISNKCIIKLTRNTFKLYHSNYTTNYYLVK